VILFIYYGMMLLTFTRMRCARVGQVHEIWNSRTCVQAGMTECWLCCSTRDQTGYLGQINDLNLCILSAFAIQRAGDWVSHMYMHDGSIVDHSRFIVNIA
jgi:hypothetical protein